MSIQYLQLLWDDMSWVIINAPREPAHCCVIIIPPASTKLKGGYTGITLSVCPSVHLSVCPSVDIIVSALYLQQYSSDPIQICTSYQEISAGGLRVMPVSKFEKSEILPNFCKFVTLTFSSFDLGSNMTQWYG